MTRRNIPASLLHDFTIFARRLRTCRLYDHAGRIERRLKTATIRSRPIDADIARVLGIGIDCVKAHMKTAFSRLEASNRSEAVAIAMSKNLLKL